jgi:hypothetical protein
VKALQPSSVWFAGGAAGDGTATPAARAMDRIDAHLCSIFTAPPAARLAGARTAYRKPARI